MMTRAVTNLNCHLHRCARTTW